MTVQSDRWIKKMAEEKSMIKPFVSKQVRKGKISFGITGNIRDYNYKITPSTSGHSISNARPVKEIIAGRPPRAQGSITKRRQLDGSLIGTFTQIRGDFSIRVRLRD